MMANAPLAIAGSKRILQELAAGNAEHDQPQLEAFIRQALARMPSCRPCGGTRACARGTDGLHDSPLEGAGFELTVPRQTGSGFEASYEMGYSICCVRF